MLKKQLRRDEGGRHDCNKPAALHLIKHYEGLQLKAYQDAVGVWTIGWGHTKTARKGMVVTESQAEALLLDDIAEHAHGVAGALKVKVEQHQFDALVSFAFNVGVGAFTNSTLLKLLNDGNERAAASQFDRWVYAGGQKLGGLVKRRTSERILFVTGKLELL